MYRSKKARIRDDPAGPRSESAFSLNWITSCLPTIRELSGRLHFLSVGRYAVKVRPLLVDDIRFRLVNKPGCQHEKIGACVPLTSVLGKNDPVALG